MIRGILLRIEDAEGKLVVDKGFNDFEELNQFVSSGNFSDEGSCSAFLWEKAIVEIFGPAMNAQGGRFRCLYEIDPWAFGEEKVEELQHLFFSQLGKGGFYGLPLGECTDLIKKGCDPLSRSGMDRIAAQIVNTLESKGYKVAFVEYGLYCKGLPARIVRVQFENDYTFDKPFPLGWRYSKAGYTLDCDIDVAFSRHPVDDQQEAVLDELLEWSESIGRRGVAF